MKCKMAFILLDDELGRLKTHLNELKNSLKLIEHQEHRDHVKRQVMILQSKVYQYELALEELEAVEDE